MGGGGNGGMEWDADRLRLCATLWRRLALAVLAEQAVERLLLADGKLAGLNTRVVHT